MFAWTEKRRITTQSQIAEGDKIASGANRRAIGLVPLPIDRNRHEIAQASAAKYRELMVSIEGNQSTCCLRVISPAARSRAAILIFRGRVLGCIYGNRKLGQQVMGPEGHDRTLSDLTQPDNLLDAYHLSEELVISSASLFHGVVLEPPTGHPEQKLEWTTNALIEKNMPGVIVVSTIDGLSVCMMYVFRGRIIGVFSFRDGWVESSYHSALRYLLETPNANISASMLTARNIDEVMDLTFSLTGLADRKVENWATLTGSPPIMNQDDTGEALRTTWQLQAIGGYNNPRITKEQPKTSGKWTFPTKKDKKSPEK
jgi:hypothetical protein